MRHGRAEGERVAGGRREALAVDVELERAETIVAGESNGGQPGDEGD
jgi:hypothetical protein